MDAMRFRLGLLIGGATGYVMGARAGRERYFQMQRAYGRFKDSKAYDQLSAQATGVTDLGRNLVAGGLDASSQKLKERAVAERIPLRQDITEST